MMFGEYPLFEGSKFVGSTVQATDFRCFTKVVAELRWVVSVGVRSVLGGGAIIV